MKYTKIGFSAMLVLFLTFAVATTPAFAINVTDNGVSTVTPAPATVDGGTSVAISTNTAVNSAAPATVEGGTSVAPATVDGGTSAAPKTVDNGTSANSFVPPTNNGGNSAAPATVDGGTSAAPKTVDNGTSADAPAPATVDNGTSAGNVSTDNPGGSINPGNNGGGNGGGGSSSSGGGSYSSGRGTVSIFTPVNVSFLGCTPITSYMKIGGDNDSKEVIKLQTILKNIEKLNVDINGTFDQKTFTAVEAFQIKYSNEVMLPWGVSTPTGQVYFTTKNKLNEVSCNSKTELTSDQMTEIENYKNGIKNVSTDTNLSNPTSTSTSTSTDVGIKKDNSVSQVASVAVSSLLSKIVSFFKWLFGMK